MGLDVSRRGLITGLIALVAAPAIVRVSSIMPVKVVRPEVSVENLTWTVHPGESPIVAYWVDARGDLLVYAGGSVPVPFNGKDFTVTFQQGKGECANICLT